MKITVMNLDVLYGKILLHLIVVFLCRVRMVCAFVKRRLDYLAGSENNEH